MSSIGKHTGGDDAARALLLDYLDGELAPEARRQLEGEMARTPGLGARLGRLQGWREALDEAWTPLSEAGWARVEEAVFGAAREIAAGREPEPPPRALRPGLRRVAPEAPAPWVERLWGWLAGSATLAAGAAAVLLALHTGVSRPPTLPAASKAVFDAPAATVFAGGAERPLAAGATVTGPAVLRLASGSEAQLTEGASARVLALSPTSLYLRLAAGSVRSQVQPLATDDYFLVETRGATVSVMGTAFTVSLAAGGETAVAVEHGVVGVTPSADRAAPRRLLAGERVEVDAGGQVTTAAQELPSEPATGAPRASGTTEAAQRSQPAPAAAAPARRAPAEAAAPGRRFSVEGETSVEVEIEKVIVVPPAPNARPAYQR